MTLPNTRWLAEIWIKRHIPAGARIIEESYTPSIINKCKVVDLGVAGFAKKSVRYSLEEFDYIILSSGSYKRFFTNPESFPDEVRIYRSIMSTHPLRKIFIPDNKTVSGPVIRIHKVQKQASIRIRRASPS